MRIDLEKVVPLWYENEEGEKWFPGEKGLEVDPPPGFRFIWIRQPNVVESTCAQILSEEGRETGRKRIFQDFCTWSEDLVLAMVTKTWWGWLWGRRTYSLRQAILIATTACERCSNVLHHRYGTGFGFAEGSKEWKEYGGSCEFCS
jgi:hypothetical protein